MNRPFFTPTDPKHRSVKSIPQATTLLTKHEAPPPSIKEWAIRVLNSAGLTPKELGIAWMMLRGLSDKEIAAETGNSVKTIKKHLGTIRAKFGVGSRSQFFAEVFGL